MRMLDLFAGRLGWSKAFLARGWQVTAVDMVEPPEIPPGVTFVKGDVMWLQAESIISEKGINVFSSSGVYVPDFDFICASSPCEEFSVHGMKHFHPNPKYPENGIRLFNHTRAICEASGVPWVMENVRAAQQFVGRAVHHCGPFYLWGTGVPAIMPQGISKGVNVGGNLEFAGKTLEQRRQLRATVPRLSTIKHPRQREEFTAKSATIPPELANAVASYAERLLEMKVGSE